MRWFPYELLEQLLDSLEEPVQSKARNCLQAVSAMRVSNGELEADKFGYFSLMFHDDDTVVVYYRPVECDLEKYDTRDALARRCKCSVDLDYVADPDWSMYLSAAFYNWQPEETLESWGIF